MELISGAFVTILTNDSPSRGRKNDETMVICCAPVTCSITVQAPPDRISARWTSHTTSRFKVGASPMTNGHCAQVLKLKRKGMSIRAIMDETGLGMQTVRTIMGREERTDRTSRKSLERIDGREAKAMAVRTNAMKRSRDTLPKRIEEAQAKAAELLKEAKGFGWGAGATGFVLPPGRYVLVLKDQSYDFTVAGTVTDLAQCLERTDAANGEFYSECQKP
jgi:hypothetical protein